MTVVLYFANPTGRAVAEMIKGNLGFIDTPLQGNIRPSGVIWCGDNGCFNDSTFREARWQRWLEKNTKDADTCVFATAPDVVGDAAASLRRSRPWLSKIRELGFPVAFVAQDGIETTVVPWDEFDCLFIGGAKDDVFKLGPVARAYILEAKRRGKWVHMGRVNSRRRCRYAEAIQCDSVDGTYLKFGPHTNLPKLQGWLRDLHENPGLFQIDGEIA